MATKLELGIRVLSEVAHLSASTLSQECDWVRKGCLGLSFEEGSDQSLYLGGFSATETFYFEGDQRCLG